MFSACLSICVCACSEQRHSSAGFPLSSSFVSVVYALHPVIQQATCFFSDYWFGRPEISFNYPRLDDIVQPRVTPEKAG